MAVSRKPLKPTIAGPGQPQSRWPGKAWSFASGPIPAPPICTSIIQMTRLGTSWKDPFDSCSSTKNSRPRPDPRFLSRPEWLHTYRVTEPSRYLIFLTPRLRSLIARLRALSDQNQLRSTLAEFDTVIVE